MPSPKLHIPEAKAAMELLDRLAADGNYLHDDVDLLESCAADARNALCGAFPATGRPMASKQRETEIEFRLTQALHEFKTGRPSSALIQLHEAERHVENALVEDEEQAGETR